MKIRRDLLAYAALALSGVALLPSRADAGPSPRFTQLTTSGRDWNAVYSPDGSKMAFLSSRDYALGDVFVMNADGSAQTKLTTDAHGLVSPPLAWSPDGTKILYTAQPAEGMRPDIFVVAADGSANPLNLTNTPGNLEANPQWSPDGGRIVLTQDDGQGRATRVCVMDADGGNLIRLLANNADIDTPPGQHFEPEASDDFSPVWSPDGREIAFIRLYEFEQHSHLYVMAADGTGITTLTFFNHLNDHSQPAWSPDGTALSVLSGPHGSPMSLYVIARATATATNVSGQLPAASGGAWSADSSRLFFSAYSSPSGSSADLFSVNSDGSRLTNVTDSPSTFDLGPLSLSPDRPNGNDKSRARARGAQLAFVIISPTQTTPDTNIYTIALKPNEAGK